MGGALRRAVGFFEGLAAFILAFMMMVTVVDVSVRAVNPLWRFSGMIEIVELALVSCFYFALPAVFLARAHITVDVVNNIARPATQRWLDWIGGVAGVLLLCGIGVQIVRPALDVLEFGETTMVLGIPKFAHWLVIWVGFYLSLGAAVYALRRRA